MCVYLNSQVAPIYGHLCCLRPLGQINARWICESFLPQHQIIASADGTSKIGVHVVENIRKCVIGRKIRLSREGSRAAEAQIGSTDIRYMTKHHHALVLSGSIRRVRGGLRLDPVGR